MINRPLLFGDLVFRVQDSKTPRSIEVIRGLVISHEKGKDWCKVVCEGWTSSSDWLLSDLYHSRLEAAQLAVKILKQEINFLSDLIDNLTNETLNKL